MSKGNLFENYLATPEQLVSIKNERNEKLRFIGSCMIQTAGILLELNQNVIVTACIIYQKFFLVKKFKNFNAYNISRASLYLACRIKEEKIYVSHLISVFEYLRIRPFLFLCFKLNKLSNKNLQYPPIALKEEASLIYYTEQVILVNLNFDLNIYSPHYIALNYLNYLKINDNSIIQLTWNYLNDSIKTIIVLVQQPNSIAVSAIWLALKVKQVEIPVNEWWCIFDVTEKDLIHGVSLILYSYKLSNFLSNDIQNGDIFSDFFSN